MELFDTKNISIMETKHTGRIYLQLDINEKINLKGQYDKLGNRYGSKVANWKAMEMPVVLNETYVWEFTTQSPYIR